MQKIIKTVMFVVTATSLLVLSGCSTAGPFVTSISSDGQGGLIVEKAYIEYSPFRKSAVRFLKENGFDIYDNKYIIFGPPNKEQYLRDRGFTNIFGFRNSTGKYRYDCSLSEDLFDIDLFNYSLGNDFRVNETDLICMNTKYNLQDRLLDSIKD